jgi:hypothetical protein
MPGNLTSTSSEVLSASLEYTSLLMVLLIGSEAPTMSSGVFVSSEATKYKQMSLASRQDYGSLNLVSIVVYLSLNW